MLVHLRPAFILLLLMTLLTGIVYPLAITGIAQVLAPGPANGSMISLDNKVAGSRLIGQAWTSEKYFWGRPSAAGDKGYNAQSSGGSNLGPTSKPLMDRVKASLDQLRQSIPEKLLPADAVTASGSGLDPDISPEFAKLQVARIAKARNLTEDKINALVDANTSWPVIGLFAERRVNVLLLNIALDGLSSAPNG